ncbi:MAG: zinc-ribbon domain-containing protein [Candidatus Heimdallarchaeota archaeon]
MYKCKNCGTEVLAGNSFCHNCGIQIESDSGFKQPDQEYLNQKKQFVVTQQPLIARNFWYWYLLSMLLSPLMYLYLYYNFEDLKKLDEYTRPSDAPPMNIDTNKILILGAVAIFCGLSPFIMPYIYYLKFEKLYQYVEAHPSKQQTRPVSGKKFAAFYIVYFILTMIVYTIMMLGIYVFKYSSTTGYLIFIVCISAFSFVTAIAFVIYFVVHSNKWQNAYNEIAYSVCPVTIQQDLF